MKKTKSNMTRVTASLQSGKMSKETVIDVLAGNPLPVIIQSSGTPSLTKRLMAQEHSPNSTHRTFCQLGLKLQQKWRTDTPNFSLYAKSTIQNALLNKPEVEKVSGRLALYENFIEYTLRVLRAIEKYDDIDFDARQMETARADAEAEWKRTDAMLVEARKRRAAMEQCDQLAAKVLQLPNVTLTNQIIQNKQQNMEDIARKQKEFQDLKSEKSAEMKKILSAMEELLESLKKSQIQAKPST